MAEIAKVSRVVSHVIAPGMWAKCAGCEQRIKFRAGRGEKPRQVIANVYEDRVWKRTEHFHGENSMLRDGRVVNCYVEAGEPYGPPRHEAPKRFKS